MSKSSPNKEIVNTAKAEYEDVLKKSCYDVDKSFNNHTVKISCSCMNDVLKIIKGQNKKVTSKPSCQTAKYNCRKKIGCPMNRNCHVNENPKKPSWTCRWRMKEVLL